MLNMVRLVTRSLIYQNQNRFLATSAKSGRSKDKDKRKTAVNLNELNEFINVEKYEMQLTKSIEKLQNEYMTSLSLRSTTGSLEKISVKFENDDYPLEEIAQISRKNPKNIIVNMSDFPTAIPDVLRAIQKSGMNLNPSQDGTTIYIPIPKVTKEYRESLSKNAKALFIKCRDNIKDVQNKYIKAVKGADSVSIDTIHNVQNMISEMAKLRIAEAEKIFKQKQNELVGSE